MSEDERSVVDLDAVAARAVGSGALWSRETTDLDVNLVRLAPGEAIEEHVNTEVDVLLVVLDGSGAFTVDDAVHAVAGHGLAVVPKGASRGVRAGPEGLRYVSAHRRRAGLGVRPRRA